MSRPGGPYRDDRYPQQHQGHPQDGYPQGYPQRGYPDQGYGQPPGYRQDPGYGQGYGADQGYHQGGYEPGPDSGYGQRQESYRPQRPAAERPSAPPPEPEREGGGFRLPGFGLLLTLLALVVQVLSLTVLPWVTAAGGSEALPAIWDVAKDISAGGFSGAYVVMFSYPLAVLGILLALVSVLESVVMKVIWAALALIGVGALALRFGWGPVSGGSFDFSRQEITLGIIALSVLVVVIFMLKMAMSTFRIVGGLILLAVAGVHVAALNDMTGDAGFSILGIGAYGPAAGYVLSAAAAFIGPRRLL
jgi:hypothetical protein